MSVLLFYHHAQPCRVCFTYVCVGDPTFSTVKAAPATFGDVVITQTGPVVWKLSALGTTLWVFHGGGDRRTYMMDGDTVSDIAVGPFGAVVVTGTLAPYKSDG